MRFTSTNAVIPPRSSWLTHRWVNTSAASQRLAHAEHSCIAVAPTSRIPDAHGSFLAAMAGIRTIPPTLPHVPLIGREAELTALSGWLAEVAAGHGGTHIIAGAGGIGKTRLVQALAARAERNGFTVGAGQVYKVESGVPYAVFSDALL